jgi:hypothetical protein
LGIRPATLSRRNNAAKNVQLWKAGQMINRRPKRTEGKAKSKMGRRREERPEEDGSEQLETKDAGEEEIERNN